MVALWVLIAIAVVAIAVGAYLIERRRRRAFQALARALGLRYHRKSRGIPKQYRFLNQLCTGHSRYAKNILDGVYREHAVLVFDFHYAQGSGKNRRNYDLSFFMLKLERPFPELRIYPEDLMSKLGQMLGYEDIDFESVEFSKAYTVRSKDKKFAYDVCHVRMMEHLLRWKDRSFEIEGEWMAMWFHKRLKPPQIPGTLDELVATRELLPEYLFQR